MRSQSSLNSKLRTVAALLVCGSMVGLAQAKPPTWPLFRGSGGSASAPKERIPDDFGPDRHVRWKRPVPAGSSSPVIWGNRLFLTGYHDSTLAVLCYRRTDGRLLWKREVTMSGEEELLHRDASPAAPTPVTDGKRIHAYFGTYGLITLDMKGKLVWKREYPFEDTQFGSGSSPILDGGSLYLVRDVGGMSAVHAFDATTGKELWTTLRREAGVNFSTPLVWRHGNREELVVAGSSILKSYDLADGKPLWWIHGLTAIACPSPTASSDTLYFGGWSTPNVPGDRRLATAFGEDSGLTNEILEDASRLLAHLDRNRDETLQAEEIPPSRLRDAFLTLDYDRNGGLDLSEIRSLLDFPTAPGKNVLVAVRGGGSGDVTDSHVLWSRNKGLPYVASPLLHGGRLYYVKKGGFFSSIDAKTGAPFYEAVRLGEGGEYYASPLGVGDRVLVGSVRGTVFVLGTGDELEILSRNDFGESIFATPAVVENTLYLRTANHLWAIGETNQ